MTEADSLLEDHKARRAYNSHVSTATGLGRILDTAPRPGWAHRPDYIIRRSHPDTALRVLETAFPFPPGGCAGEAQDLLCPARPDAGAPKTDLLGATAEALPVEQEDREAWPPGSPYQSRFRVREVCSALKLKQEDSADTCTTEPCASAA